jgi:hypothetical protein
MDNPKYIDNEEEILIPSVIETEIIEEELENLDGWKQFQETENQTSLTYGDY